MIFCAAPGDVKEAILSNNIVDSTGTVYLKAGDRLNESFSDGPAFAVGDGSGGFQAWGKVAVTITDPTATPPVSLIRQEQPSAGVPLYSTTYGATTQGVPDHLQDYRDMGPVHGNSRGGCNVLMGDGSIKTFYDTNGDGFLNPGFRGGASATADKFGYTDSKVELPPTQIFSGVFLRKLDQKTNLD